MLCHSLETLRESRILWHFIEPSFAFGASLSHFLPHCSLFFHSFWRVCAPLQGRWLAQGTAIGAFTQLKRMKKERAMREKVREGSTKSKGGRVYNVATKSYSPSKFPSSGILFFVAHYLYENCAPFGSA